MVGITHFITFTSVNFVDLRYIGCCQQHTKLAPFSPPTAPHGGGQVHYGGGGGHLPPRGSGWVLIFFLQMIIHHQGQE